MLYLKTMGSETIKRTTPEELSDAAGLVVIIEAYLPHSFLTNALIKTVRNLTDYSLELSLLPLNYRRLVSL